jgi:hypothetical protein
MQEIIKAAFLPWRFQCKQEEERKLYLTPSEGDPTTPRRPYKAGKKKDIACPFAWDNLKLQVIVHILVYSTALKKKVNDFPVPSSRDVTNKTLSGRE